MSSILYFEIEETGYGAMVSRIMTGLGIAEAFNRKPVCFMNNNNKYIFPFNSIEKRKIAGLPMFMFNCEEQKEESAQWDFWMYWNNTSLRNYFQYPPCPIDRTLDKHVYAAQLLKRVMSGPTSDFTIFYDMKKNKLMAHYKHLLHPIVVGVHVRRGDKEAESPHVPEKVYIHYLNQLNLTEKYRIFLTSDDPTMYEKMKSLLPETEIIWDHEEIRYNDDNKIHARESFEIAKQESYTAAKNIMLLGECDYVIGTQNAQFTWLGGLLCVANHDYDITRHIMINPRTHQLGHWVNDF